MKIIKALIICIYAKLYIVWKKMFKNSTEKVNYFLPQVRWLLFNCDSIISETFFLMAEG